MRRFIISRGLWWTIVWCAAIAIGFGYYSELAYRDRVASLPALVDEHGNTASLEQAMAGMDLYERARQVRKYGFVSFGVGAVLLIFAISTRREETHAA